MANKLYRNFFVKKLWPDFNKNDFNKILNKFNQIKKKFWCNIMSNLNKRILTSFPFINISSICYI